MTGISPQFRLYYGKEFALHEVIAEQWNAQGYFAHPYHFWERGLNENTNGLIRQYAPKGSSFDDMTSKGIPNIMDKLNHRPRKCLDFQTPNQVLFGINPPIALTNWIHALREYYYGDT